MPITYIGGKPRHGKTFSVVKRFIQPALSAGRTVVTNIPLTESCAALPGKIIPLQRGKETMEDIARMLLPRKGASGDFEPNTELSGALFVLDEFIFYLPSGIKASQIPEVVHAFFAMHGHISDGTHACEIVVISQAPTQINATVKALVDQSMQCEKTLVSKKAILTTKVFSGCYGSKDACFLRQEIDSYDANIYALYKSQTLGEGHGSEAKTDDATNIANFKTLKYGLPIAVLMLILGGYYGFSSFRSLFGDDKKTDTHSQLVASKSSQPSLPPSKAQPLAKPQLLKDVKVYDGGTFMFHGKTRRFFVLEFEGGSQKVVTAESLTKAGIEIMVIGELTVIKDGDNKQIVQSQPFPDDKDNGIIQPLEKGISSVL